MILPVPPRELWEGWGETAQDYLRSGEDDFHKMQTVLAAAAFHVPARGRVLDFGCAAGRMLRHWPQNLGEIWGVDISVAHMKWCQRNLSPPFMFTATTTEPQLPFEDGYFDLVYAAFVFTHIAALGDSWVLELRRILKSSGMAYITIHDEHSIELLQKMPDHWVTRLILAELGTIPSAFENFVVGGPTPRETVVFDGLRFLIAKWGKWFRVVSTTPEALNYQTALLLEKW